VILMAISLWRAVREDWKAEQRIERELRQRMRQLMSK
jgi:glycine betaine transporter